MYNIGNSIEISNIYVRIHDGNFIKILIYVRMNMKIITIINEKNIHIT